ncbi:MAG TPA: hypothetical protein VFT22_06565 [Kofleriaceae bacterium]|nr:hypothetical protein [Kofleriaceae bacterium]
MKTIIRLIFGLRTSEPLTLSVTATGPFPEPPPDLRVSTNGQEIAVPCNNNAWVANLAPGDQVAYLAVSDVRWFDVPFAFELSALATIVTYDQTRQPPVIWNGKGGNASDPKNPWPPPLAATIDPATIGDLTWLSGTLTTLNAQVVTDRSA